MQLLCAGVDVHTRDMEACGTTLLACRQRPASMQALACISYTGLKNLVLMCPAGDVYYFCGSRMQYCTCTYHWNLSGWNKAIVLWSFVLTTALGVQRLLVQLVLQGLLPGKHLSPPAVLPHRATTAHMPAADACQDVLCR